MAGRAISTKMVKELINNRGGILKNNFEYTGCFDMFEVKCKNNHIFKTTWNRIQQGSWCPRCYNECTGDRCRTPEGIVREFIKNKGGVLNKNWIYKSAHTKFSIICKRGHKFETTWDRIKHQNQWCPVYECRYGRMKTNKKLIKHFIENKMKGTVSKDWKYVNSENKFYVTCKENHRFKTCWHRIVQGHWCPQCRAKYEQEFREVIEKYFNSPFPKKRPEWLRYPKTNALIELDGYNSNVEYKGNTLKIAFEYQGWQHYKLCYLNGFSKKDLKDTKARDAFKVNKCKEKDILLIVVPYWVPKGKWITGIKNKTRKFFGENLAPKVIMEKKVSVVI